jgi:hypothetical protein
MLMPLASFSCIELVLLVYDLHYPDIYEIQGQGL